LLIGGVALAGVVCLAVLALFGGGLAAYFASSTATVLRPYGRVESTAVPTARNAPWHFRSPTISPIPRAASEFRKARTARWRTPSALRFTILTPGSVVLPLQGLTEQELTIEVNARLEGRR
jgi:hypothetical protein